MNILGIIPARGGSKGVPHKNIIDINGKPLINFTIEVGLSALSIGLLDNLIVSTNDEKIAEISRNAGASVPFIRPDDLSSDTAKSVDVLIHANNYFKSLGNEFDSIMLLQPTTPLRTLNDIKRSIEIYNNSGAESLISCYREEYICDMVSYHKDGDYASPLHQNHNQGMRRQDSPDLYIRNGVIYITSVKLMIEERKVIADKPAMYIMPKERSINIDCMDDVEMLRWKLSR